MTDAGGRTVPRNLFPIPPWARDPDTPASDKRGCVFGVEVEASDSSGKTLIALLEWELSERIKDALQNGIIGKSCDVEQPPAGCLGAGCHLRVKPKTDSLVDQDTGREYTLCRYIPPWARDPRECFNNEGDPIYGIEVRPLPKDVQPGLEYRIAPLDLDLSKNIESARKSSGTYLEFCKVEPPPENHLGHNNNFTVQRGGFLLRDEDTKCEYRLQPYAPKFHISVTPEWAMKLCDYYKTEEGKHKTSFVGIQVRDGSKIAVPKITGADLMDKFKEKIEDVWTPYKCEDVIVDVNWFRSLIRVGDNTCDSKQSKKRVFRLVHVISPKTLSDPYEPELEDPFSRNMFTVRLTDKVSETVTVSVEDLKQHIINHYVRVLSENQEEPTDEKFFSETDKPDWIEKGGKVSHGRFMWLYQDPGQDNARAPLTMPITTKPFGEKDSVGLEMAKLRGERSYSFKLERDGETFEYEVDLTTDRMIQKRKDDPTRARRVWRVGTEIKSTLRGLWRFSRKLSLVSGEFPFYWEEQKDGHVFLDMNSNEAKWVLEMVQHSVAKYEKNPNPHTGFGGEDWGDKREVLRTSAGASVHLVDEHGHEIEEKPGAIHIVGIVRLQRHIQYDTYRAHQNNILFTRQSQLFGERESVYLADNPMATGPINDIRVNEVWAFHGTSPLFACRVINNITMPEVRATSRNNTFGVGLYFTDSFIKASKYCGCPVCSNGQRGAQGVHAGCTCQGRNTTHPRIVFLTRLTMGEPLIIRDLAQYYMHRPEPDGVLPTLGYSTHYPATLWYDFVDETDALKQKRPNTRLMSLSQMSEEEKKYVPWFFYVKKATESSSGYKHLLQEIQTLNPKNLPYGIIVDDDASDESVALALKLRDSMNDCSASECLYTPNGTSLEQILREHARDENLDNIFQREPGVVIPAILRKEPGKGMKVVIPEMDKTEKGHADSLFVEDVLTCRPSQLLQHEVAWPSMFRARQLKRREMVVSDERSALFEYGILFYQYESEEAMLKNIPLEYPRNRHGIDEKESPLYFLMRTFCLDGEPSSTSEDAESSDSKSKDEKELTEDSHGTPESSSSESEKSETGIPPPDPVPEESDPDVPNTRIVSKQF